MEISAVQLLILAVVSVPAAFGAGAGLLLAYQAGLQAGHRMSRYQDPALSPQERKEALTPPASPAPVADEDMLERELMSRRMPDIQEAMKQTFLSSQQPQESNHE